MNNPRNKNEDLDLFLELMNNLYKTAKNKLNFNEEVSVRLVSDKDNSFNALGKTAAYNPASKEIILYFAGRHPKDLLRSFSHELVHHAQNCRGDFNNIEAANEGYAQENSHLREMEREAYECGNMIFRDWEDGMKKRGVVPMFNNSPFATIQMGYNENLGETKMSKKNLSESQLREIIRGVIQEMFEEDLNEDTMGMPANAEEQEAAISMAQSMEEDLQSTKGHFSKTKKNRKTKMHVDYEGGDKDLTEDSEGEETYNYGEDEGHDRKEEEGLEDHIDAIEHHIKKIKDDMGYDEDHEDRDEKDTDFKESFLPKGKSIRESARQQTYAKLLEKWCK